MRKIVILLFGVMCYQIATINLIDELQWAVVDITPIANVGNNKGDEDCTQDFGYPIQNGFVKADISCLKIGISRDGILEKIGRLHTL